MKTTYITVFLFLSCCAFAKAQTKTTSQKVQAQIDSTGNFNMLDAQAGMLGELFGTESKDLAGVTDFKSLLAKLDADPETKALYAEQYALYTMSLDPAKKDSLKILYVKMLEKAKRQGLAKDAAKNRND